MIGKTIKEVRQARGLSLGALALKAGVNKATLSRWESEKTVPYATELARVMEALGLSARQRQRCWQALEAPRALELAQNNVKRGTTAISSGELLRALRVRAQIRQEIVAHAAGVTQGMVSRWEQNECWPEADKLHAVCFALGATEEELLFLTQRGWQQHEPLPDDRAALDELVDYLEFRDTSPDRSLFYLAIASRYQSLAQRGKIRATDAVEIWGTYGYYLSWRFGRNSAAVRIAQPALPSTHSSGNLTFGQLKAVTTVVEAERARKQGKRAISLLESVEHRISPAYYAWWLTCMADSLETARQLPQASRFYLKAIENAPDSVTQNNYRHFFLWMLCRNGLYREAQPLLTPCATNETRPIVLATNFRNHAWVMAGLGEKAEGTGYLERARSLDQQYELRLNLGKGMTLDRLEHWLSA